MRPRTTDTSTSRFHASTSSCAGTCHIGLPARVGASPQPDGRAPAPTAKRPARPGWRGARVPIAPRSIPRRPRRRPASSSRGGRRRPRTRPGVDVSNGSGLAVAPRASASGSWRSVRMNPSRSSSDVVCEPGGRGCRTDEAEQARAGQSSAAHRCRCVLERHLLEMIAHRRVPRTSTSVTRLDIRVGLDPLDQVVRHASARGRAGGSRS